MSLQIAVAHTGQRFDADPVDFNSVDALKHWISRATEIPPEFQILLTPRGKHVKLQALLTEKEIFVYSRELSNGAPSSLGPLPLPEPFVADEPPDTLTSHTELHAWQNLFQSRRDWAFGILEKSQAMSRVASKHFAEQATIEKGTQIAVGNHDSHIRGLEQKHQAAREWFDGVEKETGDNLRRLDADYGQLGSIPAKLEFVQFLSKEVRSVNAIQNARKASSNRAATLQEFLDVDAVKKATGVSKRVRESFGKRIEGMAQQLEKVQADYHELLGAVGQSQSRSLVDDTEEPVRLYNEIDAVAKKVASDYEHVMGLDASQKSVAQVSKMALLHTRNFLPAIKEYSAEMSDLVRRSVEQKNFAINNAVESMRGIASIESVISNLNSELESINIPQEGVAAFELITLVSRLPYIYGTLLVEAVRRREWMEKMQKDTSSLAEEMATFQEEEERRRKRWLKPIADVLNLEAVQGNLLAFEMNVQPEKNVWPSVTREDLQDYHQILRGLDGQTSEAEALAQAIKDLDRPTKQQIKRAKNFKMGSVHEPAFGKGSQLLLRGDDEVRVLKEANGKLEEELKGSKSRQDDKARRIVRLEQELAAEKEARANLEKEAQRQAEEAVSTKQMIMENMKAQQNEFANERRSLEQEIQNFKHRIEEAEDELDRRSGLESRFQELTSELERARKDAEEQHEQAQKQVADLEAEIARRKDVDAQRYESLSTTFARLSPETALEDLALRSFNYQDELQQAIAIAKSENESTRKAAEEEQQSELSSLREQLDTEKAKAASITAELEEEREGETGSEALRKRVEEEEAKVGQSHANSLDVELMHVQKKLFKFEEFDSSRTHQRALHRLLRLLETLGFVRASKVGSSTIINDGSSLARSHHLDENLDLSFLQWSESSKPEEEDQRYQEFIEKLDSVAKRMRDMEHTARKWQREARAFQAEAHEKIAFRSFKEGDLALFLPTRNQATRPWAAFNQDSHKLHGREWLVARISKVEERVVDLSKTMDGAAGRASMDGRSIASNSALSDGLQEKSGAPGTPGLGKTTVASARIMGQGLVEQTKKKASNDPAKQLGKSLDSRRSSGTSRKSVPVVGGGGQTSAESFRQGEHPDSGPNSNAATRGASPAGAGTGGSGPGPSHLRESSEANTTERLLEGQDEVRKDLMWGP
ncbi:hypothetical protein BS50DRAFT_600381 [Corynespora cassiicola Philippines]|uniref:Autophagy-related protein 11 n=1 Tax=Corynespora cassiicola Philippines TaxID=1448308 RepID=A0A2T2NMQ2_CORCC|nr:hypothetical protein BS50DRAFT_600381 [Corynespora cassiicola Philippines]